ncbi:MAG TPA: CopY family transcriptional regulator [Phycisphaerales bacterium]|nr:CopY family transcriptional regulator [Phycisphaerales bacterium]
MARKAREQLSEAELAVLRVLWDFGPQTVRGVMERFHERGRRVAYTTVLTFLVRLEQKGFAVSDKKVGPAFVYRAKASRESVVRTRVRALLDQLYDGAAAPLALQLIENERFTDEELSKLRKLIDELGG